MFTKEDNEPKPNNQKNVASAVQTACSVVGILIALIGIPQYFSSFNARIIIAILVFIIVLFLTYGSVLPRVYNLVMNKRKEKQAIKTFAVKFSELVNQFKNISSGDTYNSIRYCLREVKNNNPSVFSNDNWFDTLFLTFKKSSWNKLNSKLNFQTHALWFDSVIAIFNDQVVCKTVNIIKETHQTKSFNNFHNDYQNARGEYDAFIRDYKNFTKDVMEKFGDLNLCRYFEMPNQLFQKLTETEKA
jgi:hypothetical protein